MLRVHVVVPFLLLIAACGAVEPVYVDGGDDFVDAVVGDDAEPPGDAPPGVDGGSDIDAAPEIDGGPDAMVAAPDTILVTAPPALVASASATFEFRSEPAGATFECQLDNADFAPCTSPHELASVPDGARRFSVRAVGAGGADPSPALHAWTVDTTAPVVTITGGPTGAVDDTTPTFTFSVTGAPTVTECAIDAGGYSACTSPYTTIGLAQGAHTVHVRARDAAGNQSTIASRAFTVDTISPTVTITGGPAEDELYLDDRVTFSFIATDATTLTRQCRIYRLGTTAPAYTPCTSPRTFDVGGGSTIVQLRFQVRATDAAANTTTVTRTFRQAVPAG